jgi:hypothetical protein
MPVGPGALVQQAGFGAGDDLPQCLLPKKVDEFLDIFIVADIHYLQDDPLRVLKRLVRAFPPNVLGSQFVQERLLGHYPTV